MAQFKCEMCGKEVKRGKRHTLDVFEMDGDEGSGIDCVDPMCKKCAQLISNVVERTKRNAREQGRL